MAILVDLGRVAMAEAIKVLPLFMAWGNGDVGWDTVPQVENISDISLVAEVGRRSASFVEFCTPDPAGSIVVHSGIYAPSVTPTNSLHIVFNFDFSDGLNETIREVGVFIGTTIKPGTPGNYFLPADILDAGSLMLSEHVQAFARSNSVRQTFEFVVNF